tara:strand:- start:384 stop:629 length:246 start_codon:yes stop_codon:yes gene_type:complete
MKVGDLITVTFEGKTLMGIIIEREEERDKIKVALTIPPKEFLPYPLKRDWNSNEISFLDATKRFIKESECYYSLQLKEAKR